MKTREELKEYIQQWLDEQEESLDKNEHGFYLYSCGASSINLPIFLESLLEDFLEDNPSENVKNESYKV